MRNCSNNYPKKNLLDQFKFQFSYKPEIIYECPLSYFDDIIVSIYAQYNELVLRKKLGIFTPIADITLLEMYCYNIIESELSKAESAKMDKSMPKEAKETKNADRSRRKS